MAYGWDEETSIKLHIQIQRMSAVCFGKLINWLINFFFFFFFAGWLYKPALYTGDWEQELTCYIYWLPQT